MNDFTTGLLRAFFLDQPTGFDSEVQFIYPIGEVETYHYFKWAQDAGSFLYCTFYAMIIIIGLRSQVLSIPFFESYSSSDEPSQLSSLSKDQLFMALLAWSLFAFYAFSCVQNPWYLLWCLPFVLLSLPQSRFPFFITCVASSLYLFNFYYSSRVDIFDPFQWWVFLPWVLASIDFLTSKTQIQPLSSDRF